MIHQPVFISHKLLLKNHIKQPIMKKSMLVFLLSFSLTATYSQAELIPDSLLTQLCRTITESQERNDSVKLDKAFEKHLSGPFSKFDDTTAARAYNYVYYRLQKLCSEFKATLDRMFPTKGDWVTLETKPATKLDKGTCRDFLKHKHYYYIEDNGDTVNLSLANNLWTDHFKDGTYSRLKLNWVDDCEFEITFIESTNESRKSISKPGDKYNYRLIEKYNRYYEVCLDVKEVNVLGKFRIYYY